MTLKRILVIDSGLKPGWTKKTADNVVERLNETGAFTCEKVVLRDEQISPCRGCAVCLERGEDKCKLRDDSANKILERMLWADAIITVTPNYSLQVPTILKNLYDRLAYVFHRPKLFKKVSLAIVVQGVYGGKKIVKYIDELMSFWGCTPVKGIVTSGGLYQNSVLSDSVRKKNDAALTKALDGFTKAVLDYKEKKPSIFRLAIFRMTRSSMKHSDEALVADKAYYAENGWLESPYYTNVRIGFFKSIFGAMIDNMIKGMIKKANQN